MSRSPEDHVPAFSILLGRCRQPASQRVWLQPGSCAHSMGSSLSLGPQGDTGSLHGVLPVSGPPRGHRSYTHSMASSWSPGPRVAPWLSQVPALAFSASALGALS